MIIIWISHMIQQDFRQRLESLWLFMIFHHLGVSINGGTPKWMVYVGKSYLEMDDDKGTEFAMVFPWFFSPNWCRTWECFHRGGRTDGVGSHRASVLMVLGAGRQHGDFMVDFTMKCIWWDLLGFHGDFMDYYCVDDFPRNGVFKIGKSSLKSGNLT